MWSTAGAEACDSLALDEAMSSLEEVLLFCFIWSFRKQKLLTIHFSLMWECFSFLCNWTTLAFVALMPFHHVSNCASTNKKTTKHISTLARNEYLLKKIV